MRGIERQSRKTVKDGEGSSAARIEWMTRLKAELRTALNLAGVPLSMEFKL